MERPKFWILRNVQFRHICGGISFWINFGRPKIWVFPCWVTTLDGCHWPQLTNSGRQFQQWSLFTFKQYCLEGILAKESSPRTKDFLLWRDLQRPNELRDSDASTPVAVEESLLNRILVAQSSSSSYMPEKMNVALHTTPANVRGRILSTDGRDKGECTRFTSSLYLNLRNSNDLVKSSDMYCNLSGLSFSNTKLKCVSHQQGPVSFLFALL